MTHPENVLEYNKPGLRIIIPGIQQAVRVGLRVITMDLIQSFAVKKE